MLSAALEFAWKYDTICDDERHMILQAKSSLLYNFGKPWSKKTSPNLFDVTMGSFDGAERSHELVALTSPTTSKRSLVTHATLASTKMTV